MHIKLVPNSVNIETSLVLTQRDVVKLIRTGYEHEQTFLYVKRIHQNLCSNVLSFDYYSIYVYLTSLGKSNH